MTLNLTRITSLSISIEGGLFAAKSLRTYLEPFSLGSAYATEVRRPSLYKDV